MPRKPMLKRGDVVHIHAHRWRDSAGNTYHTAAVSVLRKGSVDWTALGTSSITYGYGNHYEVTARKMISAAFSWPRGWSKKERALHRLGEFGVALVSVARDVRRKRDL